MPSRVSHLITDRLALSRWTPEDMPLARQLWADPAVMHLLGGALSEAQVEDRLNLEIALDRDYRVQYWPVFRHGPDSEVLTDFIGCCGLRPFPYPSAPDAHTYELGAHLLPAFWRSGYAPEAGRAVLKHAFESLGAAAIHTGHHPENTASRKVIAASQFRYHAHRFYAPTGLMHPYYRLTEADYQTIATAGQITER